MDALFLFLTLVVMITIGGLFFILGLSPKSNNSSKKAIEGTDFIPSQMYMGNEGRGGLAVNERTHKICLFTSPTSAPRILPSTDLIGALLVKNGEILGEGKRTHPKEVVTFANELNLQKESLIKSFHMGWASGGNQRIDLLVVVHDQDDPILAINFLDMETKEGGLLFEKAMSTATHWHYVLDGLILEADGLSRLHSETPQEHALTKAAP